MPHGCYNWTTNLVLFCHIDMKVSITFKTLSLKSTGHLDVKYINKILFTHKSKRNWAEQKNLYG
jgi:hypothetical protein